MMDFKECIYMVEALIAKGYNWELDRSVFREKINKYAFDQPLHCQQIMGPTNMIAKQKYLGCHRSLARLLTKVTKLLTKLTN